MLWDGIADEHFIQQNAVLTFTVDPLFVTHDTCLSTHVMFQCC